MIKIFNEETISPADLDRIMQRANSDIASVKSKVEEIIAHVRREGDEALVRFTKQWDDADYDLARLVVTEADIEKAYAKTSKDVLAKIKEQIDLARRFHRLQKEHVPSWQQELENGIIVGEKWNAIDEVGLYVPGGKNPFPTVQQILAVAAKTAGSRRIVSCISPKGNGYEVLIAAHECGVDEIYRIGGAQAIAALAYGTKSIAPVQLIAFVP